MLGKAVGGSVCAFLIKSSTTRGETPFARLWRTERGEEVSLVIYYYFHSEDEDLSPSCEIYKRSRRSSGTGSRFKVEVKLLTVYPSV